MLHQHSAATFVYLSAMASRSLLQLLYATVAFAIAQPPDATLPTAANILPDVTAIRMKARAAQASDTTPPPLNSGGTNFVSESE